MAPSSLSLSTGKRTNGSRKGGIDAHSSWRDDPLNWRDGCGSPSKEELGRGWPSPGGGIDRHWLEETRIGHHWLLSTVIHLGGVDFSLRRPGVVMCHKPTGLRFLHPP